MVVRRRAVHRTLCGEREGDVTRVFFTGEDEFVAPVGDARGRSAGSSSLLLRIAIGNERTTRDDVALAWDWLKREAAARA